MDTSQPIAHAHGLLKLTLPFWGPEIKLILKFICKFNKTRIAKTILRKKNKVEGLILPYFKTTKSPVIKIVWTDIGICMQTKEIEPRIQNKPSHLLPIYF